MTLIPKPSSRMCSGASTISLSHSLRNCCRGTGSSERSRPEQPESSWSTSIDYAPEHQMALRDWKATVLAPVAELLKSRGFRRNGTRFRANRGEADLRVALQSSQTSDRHHLKATVNLSIHLAVLDHHPSVFAPDGHWRQRIGQFMPEHPDHWWLCHDEETARRAGEQIATILKTAALPEMERLASTDALRTLWVTGRSPGLTKRQRQEFLGSLE